MKDLNLAKKVKNYFSRGQSTILTSIVIPFLELASFCCLLDAVGLPFVLGMAPTLALNIVINHPGTVLKVVGKSVFRRCFFFSFLFRTPAVCARSR